MHNVYYRTVSEDNTLGELLSADRVGKVSKPFGTVYKKTNILAVLSDLPPDMYLMCPVYTGLDVQLGVTGKCKKIDGGQQTMTQGIITEVHEELGVKIIGKMQSLRSWDANVAAALVIATSETVVPARDPPLTGGEDVPVKVGCLVAGELDYMTALLDKNQGLWNNADKLEGVAIVKIGYLIRAYREGAGGYQGRGYQGRGYRGHGYRGHGYRGGKGHEESKSDGNWRSKAFSPETLLIGESVNGNEYVFFTNEEDMYQGIEFKNVKDFSPEGEVQIGKGMHGTVSYAEKEPGVVIKRQHDARTCAEWAKEFEVHSIVYNEWEKIASNDLVRVSKPNSFVEEDKNCELRSQRLHTPGSDHLFHVMLGRDSMDMYVKNMGQIKGREQITKILGDKLGDYIKAMGEFIAFMQYGLGFTGKDLEYVYAKPYGDEGRPNIYVLDFGEAIDKVTSVEVASEAMTFVDSYPLNDPDFWESYMDTAKKFGKQDMAEAVFLDAFE